MADVLINIPAVLSKMRFVKLQKKLSIRVPVLVVNLVGRVIWGERLNEVNISKKVLQCSCSFIFNMYVVIPCKDNTVVLVTWQS